MGLNRLTMQRLVKKRLAKQEEEAMKKECVLPSFYEIHSGIMNYRTGQWISHDKVDIVRTLTSARIELAWRFRHPSPGQNAAYLKRRYEHGNKAITKTVESVH